MLGSGLIYAAIVVGWAGFFVWLLRQDEHREVVAGSRLSGAVRLLSRRPPAHPPHLADCGDLSVPRHPQPSAIRRGVAAAARTPAGVAAVRRRRRVLGLLVLAALVLAALIAGALVGLGRAPAWVVGGPAALLAACVVVLRRTRPRRTPRVRQAAADETSVAGRIAVLPEPTLSASVDGGWVPVPVPLPTYLMAPPAPRPVRIAVLPRGFGRDTAEPRPASQDGLLEAVNQ